MVMSLRAMVWSLDLICKPTFAYRIGTATAPGALIASNKICRIP